MFGRKFWVFQVPIIVFFTCCFLVTELGVQGELKSSFLRETVHPFLSRISNHFTDFKFTLRGPRTPQNKIVVVEIDGPSIERFGRWPWHRDLTAYLIEKAMVSGAKVVGLDIIFSEPDTRVPEPLRHVLEEKKLSYLADQFETDTQLKDVIRFYADRLVLAWTSEATCQPLYEEPQFCPVTDPQAISQFPADYDKFAFSVFKGTDGFIPNKTPFVSFVTPLLNIPMYTQAAKNMGYFNVVLDSDGYIRRSHLFSIARGKPFPSLALEMARVGLGEKLQLRLDSRQRVNTLGFVGSKQDIPVTPLGAIQINFRGPSHVFTRISAEDLMSNGDKIEDVTNAESFGKSKAELLRNAYVLIGLSAVGVFDMRQYPFESNAPGVYGHANILDNILSNDPLTSGTGNYGWISILILMIGGVFGFSIAIEEMAAIPALLLFVGVISGVLLLDVRYLFFRNYNWNTIFFYFELCSVFFVTISFKYVREEKSRRFLRSAFSKYVAPVVVDSILKDPKNLVLGGEKREVSILFSDIRGFTSFSESMDAKVLASFLNEYLGVMTRIVFKNEGTLDKYIGDAVMAFWGAPLNQPNHSLWACRAAIQMIQSLEMNQVRFKEKFGIDIQIGIGVNSGVVNVGNMGSEQNFEYTVIGDHVNLASRVEGLTKKYRASILTTRYTLDCIRASGNQLPDHRVLDLVRVKGKSKVVELIQIFDRNYSPPFLAEVLASFEQARRLYTQQKWQEALQAFEGVNSRFIAQLGKPDGPSEIFIERCKEFLSHPPMDGASWDGSWEMESK